MTLRAVQSVVVFVVVAVALVLFLGDLVLKGDWRQTALVAGPMAFGAWLAWLLLIRPSIRVQSDRAVVINVGRITEVPWSAVADIRRRLQLIFDLEDGRTLEAWGSPFPKRDRPGKAADADTALAVLRSAWQSAPDASGSAAVAVTRRPDTVALAVGALALAALVLSLTAVGG